MMPTNFPLLLSHTGSAMMTPALKVGSTTAPTSKTESGALRARWMTADGENSATNMSWHLPGNGGQEMLMAPSGSSQ